MAILLTGGTGKTAREIASLLQNAKIPFVSASRKGGSTASSPESWVKFNFLDPDTFENPFKHEFPNGQSISAVYLVTPEAADPVPPLKSFIDFAVQKGVQRFVLLTGSTAEPNSPSVGQVWNHLIELRVEYCVLRASWFMENFSQWQYIDSIKTEGKFYTACGDGKSPFVSAADIAAVAFYALTTPSLEVTDYRVLGPELLTHDQVILAGLSSPPLTFSNPQIAEKLSKGLGRKVEHVRIPPKEVKQRYMGLGLPEQAAAFMAWLNWPHTAQGGEERENDVVERLTGRKAERFDDWVARNKDALT